MALSPDQFQQFMAQMMLQFKEHLGSAQAQQNSSGSNAATLASALDARIGKFHYDPEAGQTFEEWLKRFGNFIEEDGKELEESTKVRLLIGKLGDAEYSKFANSILPDLPDKLKYKDAITKLKALFADSRSLFVRQYECFRLKQRPGEDIQSFTAQVNAACEKMPLHKNHRNGKTAAKVIPNFDNQKIQDFIIQNPRETQLKTQIQFKSRFQAEIQFQTANANLVWKEVISANNANFVIQTVIPVERMDTFQRFAIQIQCKNPNKWKAI
jgi:hypothetical protein